jgi:protein involved in ribonucleotide reduction
VIAYYSTASGNTHRFVKRLGLPTVRIPTDYGIAEPFILVTPTYNGRVPEPVEKFLERNHALMLGVACSGNTNFGTDYGAAGRIIAAKYGVPHVHTFELMGFPEDVEKMKLEVERLWKPAA